MKSKLVIVAVIQLLATCALGQYVGIKPHLRWDLFPEFSYHYKGRASTDYLKMRGTSFGCDIDYGFSSKKKISFQLGIGYSKNSFNKLTNVNTSFGKSDARIIDYPSLVDPIYVTDKYSYNNITFNLRLERQIELNNSINVLAGAEINNYLTYSQKYHIKGWNLIYRVKDKGLFGHSLQLTFGMPKQYRRFSMVPIIAIPIYTTWHKDDVFAENEKERRSKWLSGVSLAVQFNYSTKIK
jgi:hypothetical protein